MAEYTLEGKSVLITGGGRGIGRAIAFALAADGVRVAIAARTGSEVQQVAEEIHAGGGEAVALTADISDEGAVKSLVGEVEQAFGSINILVNNAAMFLGSCPVVDMDLNDWNRMLAVNLTGYFLVTRAVLPGMIARESGSIIMLSSTSGKRGDPGAATYCASKYGIMGFAHALTQEVRPHNIRVNVVCPSYVDTASDPAQVPVEGKGAKTHAVDVAEIVRQTLRLPPRTMIREIEIWGTNP